MYPRRLARRIVALLAAYAIALAAIIAPLRVAAGLGDGLACLSYGHVASGQLPGQAPDRHHGDCGLCAGACSSPPLLATAPAIELPLPSSFAAPHRRAAAPLPRPGRAGSALPRAPPPAS